jgi:peptide/nickel transport system ATP-binding protein
MSAPPPLLAIDGLTLEFRTRAGIVRALEDVSVCVDKGETLGIVGESGSGKSVLSYAAMRILDPAARITAGSIVFGGLDMLRAPEVELQQVRGREIAMIFQSPRTALNPIRRIGRQIEDVLRAHTSTLQADLRAKAIECLSRVRIPAPAQRYDAYPFELSGGQCQRVMIALALACDPALLIADEPTTGLDVTTQAAIMDLIRELAHERRMATVLITHDLALASESCDRIAVMHAGHIVEDAPTETLFRHPRHPYTARLIAATPTAQTKIADLTAISGSLPDLRRADLPGCRFQERCERALAHCARQSPIRVNQPARHRVHCFNPL